jgi:hypothetical protein
MASSGRSWAGDLHEKKSRKARPGKQNCFLAKIDEFKMSLRKKSECTTHKYPVRRRRGKKGQGE